MSWYYAVNGQQAGPVEDGEWQELVDAGIVMASTLVWRPGIESWVAYGTLALTPAAPTHVCQNCRQPWPLEQMIPLRSGLICATCKPLLIQRIREGRLALSAVANHFAGFWIRAVARMIDGTITSMAGYVFQIPLLLVISRLEKGGEPNLGLALGTGALSILLSLAAAGYYECWFLVNKGTTPGKMIVGLKVIRARGGPIGWKLALGRYLSYLLGSFTLYIGFLMAAWDEEKRALHDRICDTRVVSGS